MTNAGRKKPLVFPVRTTLSVEKRGRFQRMVGPPVEERSGGRKWEKRLAPVNSAGGQFFCHGQLDPPVNRSRSRASSRSVPGRLLRRIRVDAEGGGRPRLRSSRVGSLG